MTDLISPLISAKVIADSVSMEDVRLTTMELVYPRFIHAELMTHRVFSRNASSSRAIPVKRMLQMIRENPAVPFSWRMNQPGMQGYEHASIEVATQGQALWLEAMENAISTAEKLDALGLHKQIVNRVTEPFAHIKVVLTSVYWENWNHLRNSHYADPTIEALAIAIWEAREASEPDQLTHGEWHLPYVTLEEYEQYYQTALLFNGPDIADYVATEVAKKVSTARCARVSYNNFDGKRAPIEKEFDLYDKLVGSHPRHASPAEHQATPDARVWFPGSDQETERWCNPERHGNLHGWIQHRKEIEGENLDTLIGA